MQGELRCAEREDRQPVFISQGWVSHWQHFLRAAPTYIQLDRQGKQKNTLDRAEQCEVGRVPRSRLATHFFILSP